VRIASKELITFGGWTIQDGRLGAKNNGGNKFCNVNYCTISSNKKKFGLFTAVFVLRNHFRRWLELARMCGCFSISKLSSSRQGAAGKTSSTVHEEITNKM
jgi:hypothetical protein